MWIYPLRMALILLAVRHRDCQQVTKNITQLGCLDRRPCMAGFSPVPPGLGVLRRWVLWCPGTCGITWWQSEHGF